MAITFFLNGPFSQFAPARFDLEGQSFCSAEQYMMWSKAMLFGDQAMADKILASRYSHDHQALGRRVSPFDPARWDAVARDVVARGNLAKFQADPDLAAALRETGTTRLAYASPDPRWGIGVTEENPRAQDPEAWPGENWLGLALEQVRAALG
ncbi:MAG: NADAR family protein [Rhodospirillaceae bacterium]